MEIKISVDLKDVERLSKRWPEASVTARKRRITEAVLLLKRAITRETPEGAGPIHLRDTIFQEVHQSGISVWGIVGTPAIYGEPVELGTRPHFPPVAPIRVWVEKKLGYSGKEAASVAFLIARAISKRGTKGARMFGKGLEMNEARVISILEMIPDDIIKAVNA